MKTFGMIMSVVLALLGLSIMFTPLRLYFIIGWITGFVLLLHGIPLFFSGLPKKRRNHSKVILGLITSVVGTVLMVSHFLDSLTQILMVYLVAGGILLSGLMECFWGYQLKKRGGKYLSTLIFGICSCAMGLVGLIFQQTTEIVIGFLVGYHICRMGISLFCKIRDWDKDKILDKDGKVLQNNK